MFPLDAIISLGSLVIPPVFDFIKKKFIKSGKDTPESTMSTLAVTSPDNLAKYTEAMSGYIKAQVEYYNRDVTGELPVWVSALRASIRPGVVIFGMGHILLHGMFGDAFILDAGTRYFYEANIGSWFGTKMTKE